MTALNKLRKIIDNVLSQENTTKEHYCDDSYYHATGCFYKHKVKDNILVVINEKPYEEYEITITDSEKGKILAMEVWTKKPLEPWLGNDQEAGTARIIKTLKEKEAYYLLEGVE